jgi:hypothetical protein
MLGPETESRDLQIADRLGPETESRDLQIADMLGPETESRDLFNVFIHDFINSSLYSLVITNNIFEDSVSFSTGFSTGFSGPE